ncbi:neuroglobin-1-like [Bombina bombina]|uniref:neuroglobin-1-like n=1 Tax=Bombina bombina TaxID=8345 RepID=UPI00235A9F23|nr:neuroglobin-1-like [Bombina bombina]
MGCVLSGLNWSRRASLAEVAPEPILPTLNLTPDQQLLLVESWRLIQEDIAKVGVIMFIRLFETHPECKDVFFLFRDVDDLQALRASKNMRAHGLRVLSFVEKSVARINHPMRLQELVLELGRSHFTYNAQPKYYQYVGAEFIAAVRPILKENWTVDVEESWKSLFTYICLLMEKGYQEAEMNSFSGKAKTQQDQAATSV